MSGQLTLLQIRNLAKQESDMVNSQFITDAEWNSYINQSYFELYDLLVQKYGDDYYSLNTEFVTDGTTFLYPLPSDFYKLLGLDLALANTQDSFVTLHRFNFSDRNRYAVPNFQSFYGVTNMRYRLNGNDIWITPIPAANQTLRLWYVPRMTELTIDAPPVTLPGTTAALSSTVTMASTLGLVIGMSVVGSGIPLSSSIVSINPNVSIVISSPATASALVNISFDGSVVDGVSGWTEYIIIDAALKALAKEESDVSVMAARKSAMVQRIEAAAENRDAANPMTVSDNLYADFYWPTGNGSANGAGSF